MCSSDWKTEWDHDNLLMKLLDNVNNIKSPQCRLLVQRIGLVAFSDFRIIAHFTNICENDIQRFQCGRIGLDKMVSILQHIFNSIVYVMYSSRNTAGQIIFLRLTGT